MISDNDNQLRLVSLNDACRLTSLSRTMINRYRADGQFPLAVPMGLRRVAFVHAEVIAWIQERIAARAVANDNTTTSEIKRFGRIVGYTADGRPMCKMAPTAA